LHASDPSDCRSSKQFWIVVEALIGGSNFFEFAIVVAITLFGPGSGTALGVVDER